MKSLGLFVSNKKLCAEDHFPYGISRFGEFNLEQAALLEHYGTAYKSLALGHRTLVNGEERDVVLICKGEKSAQTKHETAWMRYCEKTQKRSSTPTFTGRPSAHDMSNFPSSDEKW